MICTPRRALGEPSYQGERDGWAGDMYLGE